MRSFVAPASKNRGRVTEATMTNKLWTVGIFILIVELMERLTYYTFAGSERNNLERQFGYSTAQAVAIRAVFGVLSYVTAFIGGFVADTLVGRYKAIFGFVVCYVIGVLMCSVSVHPSVINVVSICKRPCFLVSSKCRY